MNVPSSLLFVIVMTIVFIFLYFLIKMRYDSRILKGNLIIVPDEETGKDMIFLELENDSKNIKNGDYVTLLAKRK